MNTDQVVEMIDAITNGSRYVLPIAEDETGRGKLKMRTNSEEVLFYTEGLTSFAGQVDDPRTAREIAGALVAWANRKEGKSNAHGGLKLGLSEVTGPSTADVIKLMSGRDTKADWFTRNVDNMSVETLCRNFDDLMYITKMKAISDTDRADANSAKNVVWKALKEKDPTVKQCQRCLLIKGPLHFEFCEGR